MSPREHERELIEKLASRRSELQSAREERAQLDRSVVELRDQLKLNRATADLIASQRRRPWLFKLVLTLPFLPLGIVGGSASGLAAWGLLALAALPLEIDPEWVLGALALLIVTECVIGAAYTLVRIWR